MLDVALGQIEKQYGKGAVMRLGEHKAGEGIGIIPTGSLSLDIALGVGGIPRGRIDEVFGNPETTPGGRALKFYPAVRLDVRKIESLKDGAEVVGSRTRVKVVKNKVAPPFRQCEFDIIYGKGISKEGTLIDAGVDLEIVKKSGAWFTYEGEQLGQGKENARQFLAEHLDVAQEIDRRIRQTVGLTAFEDADDDKPIEVDLSVVEGGADAPPPKKSKKADAKPEDEGAREGSSPKDDGGRGAAASGPLDRNREPAGVPAG